MRKRTIWAAMILLAVSLTACEAQGETKTNEEPSITEEKKEQADNSTGEKNEDTQNTSEQTKEENEPVSETEKKIITVYYVDENAEVQSKATEIDGLTAENVWNAIIKENPVLEGVSLISCDVMETEKKIDLNLSSEFGDLLRSMGTSGETTIVTSVVNTYLDAFGCDQIKILDHGNTLVSNHKEYVDYMNKR